MHYRVKNLRLAGHNWKCTLEYWQNCECSKESVDLSIEQEKRPTKEGIIKHFKSL